MIIILLFSLQSVRGNSYTTNFSLTENPISEGGNWLNGETDGLDWHNVQTSGGKAYGTLATSGYDDPTAILKGTWGPDQTAEGTVFCSNPTASYNQEVELRLRSSMSAHSSTGYEIFFRCMKTSAYATIVRWNGPPSDFTYLADLGGSQYGIQTGDVIKATIVGNVIKGYINGVEKISATDSTYTTGNPGIGFNYGVGNTYTDFGFTSFTATDESITDTISPSIPADLSATAVSSSQINLSWTASTDNVGVAGYRIYRCQGSNCTPSTQAGTSAANSYSDTGLSPSTTYTYTVSAYDAANNNSTQSASASATTQASPPPSSWSHVQTNARNSAAASNALAFASPNTNGNLIVVEVSWTSTASFASISDSQGNAYTQIGAEQNSAGVGVKSRLYYANNIKGGSNTITTTLSGTPAYHELYIHEYSGINTANPLDSYSVNAASGSSFSSNSLTTTASNDLLYGMEIDSGAGSASAGWTTRSTLDSNVAADRNAPAAGTYAFTGTSSGSFIAWIAAFKQQAASDTQPPTTPTNLAATAISSSQINLAWTASTDNVGVAGYRIYRNGSQIGTSATNSYSDSGLSPSTTYSYAVAAYDEAGSSSGQSNSTSATTQPGNSYTTNFSLTENPISESGNWINGETVGLDWHNVLTTSGRAVGAQSVVAYSDPTALLTGSWGPNQTVEATVYSVNPTSSYYQEVEIRLRSSLSAHSATGYEIFFRCLKTSEAYAQIVRWNGPLGDFTYLADNRGSQYGVANGDVVKATIVGNVIKGYINGVEVVSATDSTYATGNPGMGFNYGVGATNVDFGFTSFTASADTTCHKSDTNCDGCVDFQELTALIDSWKVNNLDVTLREIMEAIGLWNRGC